MPEATWFKFGRRGNRLDEPLVVEPVEPISRSRSQRLEAAPWYAPVDSPDLVEAVNGFGGRVIAASPDAIDGWFDVSFGRRSV